MNITKKIFAFVGATLVAAGALAAEPSITLKRVQQRYPWNGKVDIDYQVENVENPNDYFVRFTVTTNGATAGIVMTEVSSAAQLASASNGDYRVTWDTKADGATFFAKNAEVKADLVLCYGDRTSCPYPMYYVIDVSGGKSAKSYPMTIEYLSTADANARYNTVEYKTTKIVLRRIKAQTFVMGSPEDEVGRRSAASKTQFSETQHLVTLTKDYLIGIFPVTQEQFGNVVGSNPSYFHGKGNDDTTRPVENINNAYLALEGYGFIYQLNAKVKELDGFNLPTEAQWECACRAGTQTSTYFGNNVTKEEHEKHAWCVGNASDTTHGVGQKIPNAWGLYDMLGNVAEACLDTVPSGGEGQDDDPGCDPVTNPLRNTGTNQIARGGLWALGYDYARCAARIPTGGDIAYSSAYVGFRLSCTLP